MADRLSAIPDFESREDCRIDRSGSVTKVVTCDGDLVFKVPFAWSDDEIWHSLSLMNHAHSRGYSRGQRDKMTELRRVIGAASQSGQPWP